MHASRTARGVLAGVIAFGLVAGAAFASAPAAYAEDTHLPTEVSAEAAQQVIESETPETGAEPQAAESSAPAAESDEPGAAVEEAASPSLQAHSPEAALFAAAVSTAEVLDATADGLRVRILVSGVDPALQLSTLRVGVVAAGTSATAAEQELLAVADEITAGASAGEIVAEVAIPKEKLEKGGSYEIVLWQNGDAPAAADAILATATISPTEEQWETVFPSPAPDPAWNANAAVGSLEWGVRESFRTYVVGQIAHGKITVTKPATGSSVYKFPQVQNTWNAAAQTGTVSYAGNVNFWGHDGVLNLDLANPTVRVKDSSTATLEVAYEGEILTIATIDLKAATAKKTVATDGSIRFSNTAVKLTEDGATKYFQNYVSQSYELDPLTFTIGADAKDATPVTPPKKPGTTKPTTPQTTPTTPLPTLGNGGAQAAGSLKWGISSYFSAYTSQKSGPSCPTPSKHCAGGSISTSGVGSGWLFPQAVGSDWNAATQTGTVQFSGRVSFNGYGLTMYQVSNPRIVVSGPQTATLYTGYAGGYGPSSVPLDLGAASKTVGSAGEVTWSNVPVQGGLSGISAGQAINFDSLTFTVGAVNTASYSATQQGVGAQDAEKRTPAASPPATTGITVLTDPDQIRAGGRIELEASGFDADDEGVLVVLYSDPLVLDEKASANSSGVVRWSGTLPDDISGAHTITFQGSINAGAQIKVLEKEAPASAKTAAAAGSDLTVADQAATAGFLGGGDMRLWEWWVAAGGLVAIAACTTTLAIRQRSSLAAVSAA